MAYFNRPDTQVTVLPTNITGKLLLYGFGVYF